jgi:Zn-dependent protease
MKNFNIGRILGVDIYLNLWFLVFLGIIFALKGFYFFLILSLLYLCVLLHEFGHVLVARYFNIGCQGIVLTPLGGIAIMNFSSKFQPKKEFFISVAGPLITLVIAIFCGLLSNIPIFKILCILNIVLFVFNLIPAYPMDGGRILKSILALFFNHKMCGRIVGIVGMGLGCLMILFFLSQSAIMGALIGGFVIYSAYNEYKDNK